FAEPTDRVSIRSSPQPASVSVCPAAVKGYLWPSLAGRKSKIQKSRIFPHPLLQRGWTGRDEACLLMVQIRAKIACNYGIICQITGP
ncbi:hypothetical protein, partial [Falsigemmobacter intermedius]|uniref:hypothetical protein n=1 Tax=Falsigemmobacter intermedius TaxID=1553448 RepID=UPI0035E47F4E